MMNHHKNIKHLLFILIFTIAIVNHVLHEPKIATAIGYISLIPLFLFFKEIHLRFLKFILPLILVFLSGLIFSYKHVSSDMIRDVFYYLNFILFLLIGVMYASYFSFQEFLRMIIRLGTLLSIIYLIQSFFRFGFEIFDNLYKVRTAIGVGNSTSVIALLLLLFTEKYQSLQNIIAGHYRLIMIVTNAAALILFGSRTYMMVFLIGLACLAFPLLKRKTFQFMIVIAFAIAGLFVLLNIYEDTIFVKKFNNSLTEISTTTEFDEENAYLKFRGYETAMAINTFKEGGLPEKSFGHGFGKLINLNMLVELGGERWRHIPVLHNGYSYVLVKTGIIGIFFLFLFFFKTIALAVSIYKKDNEVNVMSLLTLAVLFAFMFETTVVGGIFNMEFEIQMIIFGALIQFLIFDNTTHILQSIFKKINENDQIINTSE